MKNKSKLCKTLIYIVLSVLTVLTGLLFIIQVQRIYHRNTDSDLFSREIVGKYILEIIVPIILWLVAVVVSIVINFIHKLDDTRKSKNSNITKLQTIVSILPFDKIEKCDLDYISLKKESKNRKIAYAILAVVLLCLAIFPASYLFNTTHYESSDATAEVKKAVLHILPFVIIGFVCGIIVAFYNNYSALKSIEAAKKLLAKYKKGELNYKEETRKQLISLWCIRGAIILIAVIFIISGIANGGPDRVYMKAAKICTECIGLG